MSKQVVTQDKSVPTKPSPRIAGRDRVIVEGVRPQIDGGRFPIKRVLGETVQVVADVFADGHDEIACNVLFHHHSETDWHSVPMVSLGNSRWTASFSVTKIGSYLYTVEGYIDRFGTWQHDLIKRVQAGSDQAVDYQIGATLIQNAARTALAADAALLSGWARQLVEGKDQEAIRALALSDELLRVMSTNPDRRFVSRFDHELGIFVDRKKARFSTWYEFFPRSTSPVAGKHGTFRDAETMLPYVASMNFDVVYLPPVHPIGQQFRKGKNNAVTAEAGDVGSPWAIGAAEGGHKAIHPQLGTFDDFDRFMARAKELHLETALDIAFQCTPDHPYVHDHPNWFRQRPDGTIQYAENPPKKYQDIYPIDFESEDWESLWAELKSIFVFWSERGVRIFRVDNPHTKAFPFWEWCISEIKKQYPDVLFLAEAFTKPRIMERLAKLGFSQSYTYFTWRNTKAELIEYLTELTQTDLQEYFRPNFWPNTPDILHESLQTGGRSASMFRVVLAGTLTANYGIYGPAYELAENTPRNPGSEEYLNSEKYEIKQRDLNWPWSLKELIGRVNAARRQNTALQTNASLHFHNIDNPMLLCYSKTSEDLGDVVVVVVNIDPFTVQSGWVDLDLSVLGLRAGEPFLAHDLLTGDHYTWTGSRDFVQLSPGQRPAHIFELRRRIRTEQDFG